MRYSILRYYWSFKPQFKFLWSWQEETLVGYGIRDGIRLAAVAIGCRIWDRDRLRIAWMGTAVASSPPEFAPVHLVKRGILFSIYLSLLAGKDLEAFLQLWLFLLRDVVPFPFQDESLSLSPPRIVPGSRIQWILPDKRPADKVPDCYQRSGVRGVQSLPLIT